MKLCRLVWALVVPILPKTVADIRQEAPSRTSVPGYITRARTNSAADIRQEAYSLASVLQIYFNRFDASKGHPWAFHYIEHLNVYKKESSWKSKPLKIASLTRRKSSIFFFLLIFFFLFYMGNTCSIRFTSYQQHSTKLSHKVP